MREMGAYGKLSHGDNSVSSPIKINVLWLIKKEKEKISVLRKHLRRYSINMMLVGVVNIIDEVYKLNGLENELD